jgi:hypothetical protein
VSDDESFIPHHDDEPASNGNPPTPAVEDSPPPSPRLQRQRSMARLRPVSIPDMVKDLARNGMPAGDASARGNADSHRADRKRKSDGISRSLSEVFAYLTHGTASLKEAKKLLAIIYNVCNINNMLLNSTYAYHFKLCMFFLIFNLVQLIYLQLDLKPAYIKYSSLRTMAKHVRPWPPWPSM